MNSDTAESVRYVTKSFAIKKPVDEVLCAGRFNSFRCALPLEMCRIIFWQAQCF